MAKLPQFTVLTDRDDGTLWVLSHDATGVYVTINSLGLLVNPAVSATVKHSSYNVYGVEGVVIPDEPSNPIGQKAAQKRLFVRGGRLGYENTSDEVEQGRVMTRRGMSGILRRIIVPNTWRSFSSGDPAKNDDVLGYRVEDLS